jgi:hypothetical protein
LAGVNIDWQLQLENVFLPGLLQRTDQLRGIKRLKLVRVHSRACKQSSKVVEQKNNSCQEAAFLFDLR